MTDVVVVRHGETVWHAENRYAGATDVALTDRGREQAAALATWARDAGLVAAWSSPLSRARETVGAVCDATGLSPREDARLAELDFGAGEGLTRAEMRERFPSALEAFLADPVAGHLPGGEDPRAAADRAVAALDDLAAAHPEGRVLIVAHTTIIRLALCRVLGLPLADYRRRFPQLGNATLTELRLADGPAALLRYNAALG